MENQNGGWVPTYSDLMGLFSQKDIIWKFFRKIYGLKIDKARCKQCGLCAKLRLIDNIGIREYPKIKNECIFCM